MYEKTKHNTLACSVRQPPNSPRGLLPVRDFPVPEDYRRFIETKTQYSGGDGFAPVFLPERMFDFQLYLLEWALTVGRDAVLADCGMGKTFVQLAWAENIARKTGNRVIVLTPLAVSAQTVAEGEKFGIEAVRSKSGKPARIVVTNYESLHLFDRDDFIGAVCDESSILKSYDGVRRGEITEFMRKMPYRLLCSATAAPNDYIELGTSSEALGYLGHMDMLNRFFKNDLNNSAQGRFHGQVIKWRFKGHAEEAFWKYVVSWARAVRKPSDIGFEDREFTLLPLTENEHVVGTKTMRDGMLFPLAAIGLREQREERRITIEERCDKVAELVKSHDCSLIWCHLNDEGDTLARVVPDSVQVSGTDSDDAKEEKFLAFTQGKVRRLITKEKIGAWGLNFQHCAHETTFPSHSFEGYYQAVRRCWRFGQKRPVTIDIVTTEGERGVMENLKRKATQADEMFTKLVALMNQQLGIAHKTEFTKEVEVPAWL
jgi:hypothetical protein